MAMSLDADGVSINLFAGEEIMKGTEWRGVDTGHDLAHSVYYRMARAHDLVHARKVGHTICRSCSVLLNNDL